MVMTPDHGYFCPAPRLLTMGGRSANRLYTEIDPQPGHVREKINVERLPCVAGEPRHIIADLTAGPSQVVYEFGCMSKLDECLMKKIGKLTVVAFAKVEHAIAVAIGAR